MKKLLVGAALVLLLGPRPAASTTFVRVPDAALADQAQLAVVGTVESRAAAHGKLATDYRVRVDETLAGAPETEIVVRVPGGGDGPRRRTIWGAPSFRPGERVLLFLRPGEGGTWRVLHLFLGAFHRVELGARAAAIRDLSEAQEVTIAPGGALLPAPASAEPLRDFAAFAQWVTARRRGEGGASYLLPEDEAGELRSLGAKATFFEDPQDGRRLRWFTFDGGGHVGFLAYYQGQPGVPGGGYAEFQTGLQAWNAESHTPIDYRYDGTTHVSEGPSEQPTDSLNTIVFNDPEDLVEPFDCATGGVLAFGGPVYFAATQPFRGELFHPIDSGDIVVANGLGCFFQHSPNASKAAEELFAHELGHTLGLAHSCGDSASPSCEGRPSLDDALMRAFVHDDARGARLASDDVTAIRSLYEQASVPAAPTELTAVATSTSQAHLAWKDNAANETGYVVEMALLGGSFQATGSVLPASSTSADVGGLAEATGYQFRVKARNASGDSTPSNVAVVATNATVAPCVVSTTTLCLSQQRFAVRVQWATGGGASGEGAAVPQTEDTGLFWFFGPSNLELMVKVLDACSTPVPRFWVFFGGTTDVEFRVTVVDTQTGAVRVYFNPQGHLADAVGDVSAFATCP